MKKQANRGLKLKAQTVRLLDAQQLQGVAGGATTRGPHGGCDTSEMNETCSSWEQTLPPTSNC
jgi:hypothetical protein